MGNQEYLDRLIAKAAQPGTTRERRRMLLWKAISLIEPDTATIVWRIKINFKMWVHEKLFGTDWCE